MCIVIAACAQPAPISNAQSAKSQPAPASVKPPDLSFCGNAAFITIGRNDKFSLETANQIIAHNEKGVKLCGWKRPR